MKKSCIFFAVFLLVLIVAVLSERREKEEFSDRVAMGDQATTQIATPDNNIGMEE
ncbi:hypothetical protein [Lentiprolixibacter aurantiacus]|uniref:Uncharacterized protein n=1 Tax=Lentiprolixibacter aurantiacus TaxID=2993939 RepID=A0AAE3SMV2_9FLAO|nr:hypothetical protein [Lentiprolixibacter aurantiacus]MCX2718696.1 hypothetical protein [Lentiprolixibacter aurantiacus]